MRHITALLLACTLCLPLFFARPATAQSTYKVVAVCGAQAYTAGQFNYGTIDVLGNVCGATAPGDPITIANQASAPAEASSTVTVGGTFQTVFAANATRINCFIENPTSATEPLYVHWTAASATTANSASLGPGASFSCAGSNTVVTGAVQVTATTTGHAFVASGS